MDKPIYPDCNNDIHLITVADFITVEQIFQSKTGDTSFCVPILSGLGLCEIDLPTVRGSFMGENIFAYPQKAIWHKTVSNNEFICPELPVHWSAELYLGLQRIPYSSTAKGFEIGNFLYSYHADGHHSEPLILRVNGPCDYYDQWSIVTIL